MPSMGKATKYYWQVYSKLLLVSIASYLLILFAMVLLSSFVFSLLNDVISSTFLLSLFCWLSVLGSIAIFVIYFYRFLKSSELHRICKDNMFIHFKDYEKELDVIEKHMNLIRKEVKFKVACAKK